MNMRGRTGTTTSTFPSSTSRLYKALYHKIFLNKNIVRKHLGCFHKSGQMKWMRRSLVIITHCNEYPIYEFFFWELRCLSPNFHIHGVWERFPYSKDHSTYSCSRIGRSIVGFYKSLTDTWIVEMELWLRNCFSGNTCFEFSVLVLCSAALTSKPWFLCRGPTELVQHFAYTGNSHRRKCSARHGIDMVWLYRSGIPVGFYLFNWILPAVAAPGGGAGGVSTLWF